MHKFPAGRGRSLALAAAIWCSAVSAAAEGGDSPRLRLALGGDASATIAPEDHGFFNQLDYGSNLLRLARLSLAARLDAGSRVGVLAELRLESKGKPRFHALYLSLHPFRQRPLDFQIGRIPPVFGAYPRRAYSVAEPLPSAPLVYQYLTNLRSDALPASADEVLRQRGAGWRVRYPIGVTTPDEGLPMISAFRWDTGVQLRAGSELRLLEVSAALTQGSLSHPLVRDDNDGKQIAGRACLRPLTGLALGVSGARGQYVDDVAMQALEGITGSHPRMEQEAFGVDLEYSRGHALLRAEAVWNRWQVPAVRVPTLPGALRNFGAFVEGHYRPLPGLTLAMRGERVSFATIRGSARTASWDAPVWRIEGGAAYALHRHAFVKLAYQYNWRDGGLVRHSGLLSGQLALWF